MGPLNIHTQSYRYSPQPSINSLDSSPASSISESISPPCQSVSPSSVVSSSSTTRTETIINQTNNYNISNSNSVSNSNNNNNNGNFIMQPHPIEMATRYEIKSVLKFTFITIFFVN